MPTRPMQLSEHDLEWICDALSDLTATVSARQQDEVYDLLARVRAHLITHQNRRVS